MRGHGGGHMGGFQEDLWRGRRLPELRDSISRIASR
jgi:hypothetical protein